MSFIILWQTSNKCYRYADFYSFCIVWVSRGILSLSLARARTLIHSISLYPLSLTHSVRSLGGCLFAFGFVCMEAACVDITVAARWFSQAAFFQSNTLFAHTSIHARCGGCCCEVCLATRELSTIKPRKSFTTHWHRTNDSEWTTTNVNTQTFVRISLNLKRIVVVANSFFIVYLSHCIFQISGMNWTQHTNSQSIFPYAVQFFSSRLCCDYFRLKLQRMRSKWVSIPK